MTWSALVGVLLLDDVEWTKVCPHGRDLKEQVTEQETGEAPVGAHRRLMTKALIDQPAQEGLNPVQAPQWRSQPGCLCGS